MPCDGDLRLIPSPNVIQSSAVAPWHRFAQDHQIPKEFGMMSSPTLRGETTPCFSKPTSTVNWCFLERPIRVVPSSKIGEKKTSWAVPCGMFDLVILNMFLETCWKETAQTLCMCHTMLIIENPPNMQHFSSCLFGIVFGQRLKAFWPHVSAKSMVAVISLVLPSMLSPHLTTEAAFEVLKSYPQKTEHDHILSYSHFIEILETKSWAKNRQNLPNLPSLEGFGR